MESGKNYTVGVLINEFNGRYQTCIRSGISFCAQEKNVQLAYFAGKSLDSPYGDENSENTIYTLPKKGNVDGIIILTGSTGTFLTGNDIRNFVGSFGNIPTVTIGIPVNERNNIAADGSDAIRELMHHLAYAHTYKHFAFLFGPGSNHDAEIRKRLYLEAAEKENIAVQDELCMNGDFSYASGMHAAGRFKEMKELPFDVIVCANDDMALGFMYQMGVYGFVAPRDYAVTGFDNTDDGRHCRPRLTTVDQSLSLQGYAALEKLYVLLSEGGDESVQPISSSLCIRESCGCNPVVNGRQTLRNTESLLTKEAVAAYVTDNRFDTKVSPSCRNEIVQVVRLLSAQLFLDLNSLRQNSLFISTLNEWLDTTEHWQNYLETWTDIIRRMHEFLQSYTYSSKETAWIETVFAQAYSLLAEKTSRYYASRLNNDDNAITLLCRYLPMFSHADSVNEIMDASARLLMSFSVPYICVCLNDEPFIALPVADGIKTMQPYGTMRAYMVPGNGGTDYGAGTVFSSNALLPDGARELFTKNDCVFLPLVQNDSYFGYVCIPYGTVNPIVYEIIRSCISHICDAFVQTNKARFRPDINSIPLQYIETDLHLRILSMNDEARESFGPDDGSRRKAVFLDELLEDGSGADRERLYELVRSTENRGKTDYPGVLLINKSRTERIPVIRTEAVMRGGNKCVAVRWYLFPLLPFSLTSFMPPDSFYDSRGITQREREILLMVREGKPISAIAGKLCIAESTVKGHITKIYDKLGVSGRSELNACLESQVKSAVDSPVRLFSLLKSALAVKD